MAQQCLRIPQNPKTPYDWRKFFRYSNDWLKFNVEVISADIAAKILKKLQACRSHQDLQLCLR